MAARTAFQNLAGRLAIAVGATALSLCAHVAPAAAADPIKVGIVVPLSGAQAGSGELVLRGYRLHIDEVNASGGVAGRKIELFTEDDRADATTSTSAVEKLISQRGVVAILGSYGSAPTTTGSDVSERHKIPYIAAHAGELRLHQRGLRFFFNIHPGGPPRDVALATFFAEVLKPKSVAGLHSNQAWSIEGMKTLATALKEKAGVEIRQDEFPANTPDMSGQLTRIKAGKPDLVSLYGLDSDNATFLRQALELGLNPRHISVLGDVRASKAAAGLDFDTLLMCDDWFVGLPGAENEKYERLYRTKFPKDTPDRFAVKAYAAAQVLVDALKRARSIDGQGVRDALSATDIPTPVGQAKFKEDGQRLGTFVVAQYQKGAPVVVYPESARTSDAQLRNWRGFR